MIAALRRAAHVVLATLVATSPLLPTVDAAAASLPPAADSGRGVPLPHTCPGGGYPGASRATTAHPPAVGALLAAAPVAAQEQQGEAPSRPPSGRWVHLGREAWRLEQLAEELTDASIPTPSAAAIQTALAEVGEQRWDDARKTLDRAIKRDPEEVSARYARALVRLRSPKPLKLEDVRKDLAVVVRLQPFFRNAFELWLLLTPTKDERKSMAHLLSNLEGKREGEAAGQIRWMRAALELQRGKPKDALRLLAKEPPEKAAPGAATQRALLVRMWALFDAEDDAAGQRLYFDLLEGADKQLMERFYRDAVLLVKEDEEKSFEAAEETDKVEWFRQFWTRRDPRPADELNPRIGEHYRRLSKARREYGLQSNGHGYFVDWQEFLKLTPELPYFAPSVVFDDQQASGYWIDHRGLWLVRHGEPDYAVKPRHSGNLHLDDNTTWLYSAFLPQPFVVHLVRRRALGEWVQVLNLGVAAAGSSSVDDEPVEVAGSMTGAFRQLYSSRADLDQLFLMITRADSLNRLISLLTSESKAMAGFAKSARIMDSTDYYSREDMLPMALSLVDWRRPDGQTDLEVEVAIDTRDIEWNQTGKEAAVELSLLLYDADWQGIVYRADRRYPVQSSDQQPGGTFITSFDAGAIEPGEYHYALQVNEPSSGRIGMARGTHAVDYYGTDWVDLSDLSLRVPVPGSPQGPNASNEAGEAASIEESVISNTETAATPVDEDPPWIRTVTDEPVASAPVPYGVIQRTRPAFIAYQIYNLAPGADDEVHYEIEQRLLTLQEGNGPGAGSQVAGIASQVAQAMFPLYSFIALTGLFGIGRATKDPNAGLFSSGRSVDGEAQQAVNGVYWLDPREMKKGIYELYITIKDKVNGSRTTKSLIFRVTGDLEVAK